MKTYYWREINHPNGAWRVGREAVLVGVPLVAALDDEVIKRAGPRLMRHWPTGVLELVPAAWLKPYPSEPIQEPTP